MLHYLEKSDLTGRTIIADNLTNGDAAIELECEKKRIHRAFPTHSITVTEDGTFKVLDFAGRHLFTVAIREQYAFGRGTKTETE